MENSCRKKYKSSQKKWIFASSYPKFRRNSALIPANAGLFHYAANNPVRYIDPEGRWTKNEDGSYTAQEKDTLWGLSQETGIDWRRDTDYSGKPENLQVGQTIRIKNNTLEKSKTFFDWSANVLVSGSQYLAHHARGGVTKVTSCSLPLKCLDNPSLMAEAKVLYRFGDKLGKIALGLAFACSAASGIDTGIKTNSFWHGFYKGVADAVSTGTGYAVTYFTSPAVTPVGGIALGIASSFCVDWFSKKIENLIWKTK